MAVVRSDTYKKGRRKALCTLAQCLHGKPCFDNY